MDGFSEQEDRGWLLREILDDEAMFEQNERAAVFAALVQDGQQYTDPAAQPPAAPTADPNAAPVAPADPNAIAPEVSNDPAAQDLAAQQDAVFSVIRDLVAENPGPQDQAPANDVASVPTAALPAPAQ